jgi:hypothetical protein
LKIDDLRNEMRMLGAGSVGPIDMGTEVMSVASVGPPDCPPDRSADANVHAPRRTATLPSLAIFEL